MSMAADGIPVPAAAGAASYRSLEQAAEWYATLRSEDAGERERRGWQAWLAQSPEHAQAWAHVEAVGRRFEPLRADGRAAAVAGTRAARRAVLARRHAANGLAGLAVLGLAAWLGWRHTPLAGALLALGADHRTGVGERRDLVLADGSQVWLDTATALSVDDRGSVRRLDLRAGQILVQTAAGGAGRPFYVETCFGRLQALGTRFAVRLADDRAWLDVFEGTVEIRTAASGAVQRVPAGQRTGFDAERIGALAPAERAQEAWRRGIVLADNIPLERLVGELARYRHGHIGVAPEVAQLAVVGVYPADDPDRALAMLERSLPVRVRRTLPWWTTVEPR